MAQVRYIFNDEALSYQDGELFLESVRLRDIADAAGTPFFAYSSRSIVRQYDRLTAAFSNSGLDVLVCYAMKANSNQSILNTLVRAGAGVDVLSKGELVRALQSNVDPQKIVFGGVAKTPEEIKLALEANILQFNVDSEPELDLIASIASARGQRASVALRVNPDVGAGAHSKITTGRSEDKFGIPWRRIRNAYAHAAQLPSLEVRGVATHIGSQITELTAFERAFERVSDLVRELRRDGHEIRDVDLGGGLGIQYVHDEKPPNPDEYAALVVRHFGQLGCQIVLEPGRYLVGNAGVLVSEVLYVKQGDTKTFVIVDSAMNDLIRPTLYEAHHEIVPLHLSEGTQDAVTVDVVGGACEAGDYFAQNRKMPALQPGDLVAILSVGAYGAVQSSNYNTRPLSSEVMVNGPLWEEVRPRQTYEDLIGMDRLPSWLSTTQKTVNT